MTSNKVIVSQTGDISSSYPDKSTDSEKRCFKCGRFDGEQFVTTHGDKSFVKLIVHHVRYNPEKTELCCWSCHQSIHKQLRKTGECGLSVKEAAVLSSHSSGKRWRKKSIKQIGFSNALGDYLYLHEAIRFNSVSGNVTYTSGFRFSVGTKYTALPVLGEI